MEFMFLISTFVPSASAPAARSDTFASQRSEPSSIFTSETSSDSSVARSSRRYAAASSGERMSGSLTHSTRGTPARLKSSVAWVASWIRPEPPPCVDLPVSSSMWTRVIPTRLVEPSPSSISRWPPTQIGKSYWLI